MGVRIRVIWDETVVEDRIHFGDRIFIGSGSLATVAVPGEPGRYVVLTVRGKTIELRAARGTADAIEFPGEPVVDARALDETLVRSMEPPFGSGRITVGGAVVEFERWVGDKPRRDKLLFAFSMAAALLAMLAGGSYRLVRLFGDGERPLWGRPPSLSEHDASSMRVHIGPDGMGAMRPQAGLGLALRGRAKNPLLAAAPVKHVAPKQTKARSGHPRATLPNDAGKKLVYTGKDGEVKDPSTAKDPPTGQRLSREKVIENAQAALLQADLRSAIDSFSTAAKKAPLDYDQLNWLGLAHYLNGEYDDASTEWQKARGFDDTRADAINNLASLAKRRGDTDGELALLRQALDREPHDCHASNSLALALAKSKQAKEAETELAESDSNCGGGYAYTSIQRAAIRALAGDKDTAFKELEAGLSRIDTMIPVKEYEVLADLTLDPAFANLRSDPRFDELTRKYLPRATANQAASAAESAESPSEDDSEGPI